MFQHLPMGCNALVIGASRGIGQALCAQLASHPQVNQLYAASRSGQSAHGIAVSADICTQEGRQALVKGLGGAPLHLLINTVGRLHGEGLAPEKRLESLTEAAFMDSIRVNALAQALTVQALLPHLAAAGQALIGHLSARVGSIGDNHLGGWYSYRAAKAAQNQLNRTLAVELGRRHPGVLLLTLHPGTTDTALSRPFGQNVPPERLFSPQRAAGQLLAILEGAGPQAHGGFWAWDGSAIPW